ncbi:MAG: hypothetical protein JXA96_05365 [Sedimentisphaerales bacterium]|nr:hypothetical protein [Sedimentisphaerales bacterium]
MFFILLGSCTPRSDFGELSRADNTFPNDIKIGDLAPVYPDGSPGNNLLKAISIDFHVLEIPEENFSKLDEIRRTLNIRPIKFNNYLAFSANSFSAYYGRNQTRSTVYDLLQIAGAKHVTNQAIILIDGETTDIPIQQLPQMQVVYFSNLSGDKEAARVGPGYITMHISVKKADTLDDAASVAMFPLFTRMSANTISQYAQLEKLHDFPFYSAALQLNMIPGDFIFLAPESHIDDQTTLSGLFFSNPQGSMFFDPQDKKPPERKPSVRIYVITCLGLNF